MGRGPYRVEAFVGQKLALRPALRLQDGAKARGEPAPHMLFTGPSGCGKSLAAYTLGERAGTAVNKFLGKVTADEIARRVRAMQPHDIAFLDEAHNLDNDSQELLFTIIDANHTPTSRADDRSDGPGVTPPVTLILATDRPGRLLNALMKRIPLTVCFKPYPPDEMKEIVARIADRRGVLLSPQAAGRLARVCHGIPRRAEHHVGNMRLTFEDSERRQLSVEDVRTYLEEVGLDEDGLDGNSHEYMQFLGQNGTASAEALAGFLGTDVDHLKTQIEQPLRHRGLVTVGKGGRVLTERGEKWVTEHRKARRTKRDNCD